MDSSHESACEKAHVQGILSSYVPFLSVKIIFPELILKGNQHLQLNGNQWSAREDQSCVWAGTWSFWSRAVLLWCCSDELTLLNLWWLCWKCQAEVTLLCPFYFRCISELVCKAAVLEFKSFFKNSSHCASFEMASVATTLLTDLVPVFIKHYSLVAIYIMLLTRSFPYTALLILAVVSYLKHLLFFCSVLSVL